MKKLLITVVFFITIATYSQQKKEWILINDTEDATFYIRKRTDDSAWFKTSYKNDKIKERDDSGNDVVVRNSLVLFKFECTNLMMGVLSSLKYDKDGNVITSNNVNELFLRMEYVIPDTNGEFIFEYFCENN
jgi:hypothetical protein